MSCLGGVARGWAYGRRLTDPTCFSTYEVFKEELREAFEPPQNEFRSRTESLDLQQGKYDVHAYAQRARYLVSNIVTNPLDEAAKVVTFMKGLKDGCVKTYLIRECPSTLEAAIMLAMQEEFSLRQTKLHANARDRWTYRVRQLLDLSSVVDQRMSVVSGMETAVTTPVSAQRLCTRPRADVTIPGIATGKQKTKATSRRGAPAGNAVERVDIGHAVS
ncbi:unnamed protein product [Phytophthora fragariaefolia]|uniref:Unnamed protein product n=1 Tax=Phytophthora fragariaefolia TaxID=1490495 RepID=A0A9W6X7F4_9STRA|nr:unnamed protein product [Phytophthora fragariaefolia]